MDREAIDRAWFDCEPIRGVTFALNEPVNIIAGEHAGQGGSTIAIVEVEPEPIYLVELGSGYDVTVAQSALRSAQRQKPMTEIPGPYTT